MEFDLAGLSVAVGPTRRNLLAVDIVSVPIPHDVHDKAIVENLVDSPMGAYPHAIDVGLSNQGLPGGRRGFSANRSIAARTRC